MYPRNQVNKINMIFPLKMKFDSIVNISLKKYHSFSSECKEWWSVLSKILLQLTHTLGLQMFLDALKSAYFAPSALKPSLSHSFSQKSRVKVSMCFTNFVWGHLFNHQQSFHTMTIDQSSRLLRTRLYSRQL